MALDGDAVETFEQMRDAVAAQPGARIELAYERDGRTRTTSVTLDTRTDDGREVGFIGVGSERVALQRWTLPEAFAGAWVGEPLVR